MHNKARRLGIGLGLEFSVGYARIGAPQGVYRLQEELSTIVFGQVVHWLIIPIHHLEAGKKAPKFQEHKRQHWAAAMGQENKHTYSSITTQGAVVSDSGRLYMGVGGGGSSKGRPGHDMIYDSLANDQVRGLIAHRLERKQNVD